MSTPNPHAPHPRRSSGNVLIAATSGWYTVRALPRLFHEAGARVSLLAPRGQPLRASRYVDRYIAVTGALHAALTEHLLAHHYDLMVVTDEPAVELLAQMEPPPGFLHGMPESVLRALSSRSHFFLWAQERGIAVPPGLVCRTPAEAAAWVRAHGAGILKRDHSSSGGGVRGIHRPEDAQTAWESAGKPGEALVQRFVSGPVGAAEVIARDGRVLAWFSSTKERTVSTYGASVMRRWLQPPGMEQLVTQVTRETGFTGLFGFDWIMDEATGEPLLIEFHPRPPSGFGYGPHLGVDVALALRRLLEDDAPAHPPMGPSLTAEAPMFCYFPEHLWLAIRRRRSDLRFWLPRRGVVAWQNVPLDDPGALALLAWTWARRLLQRAIRRSGR